MKWKETIIELIAYSFIALFVYTAVSKWMDFHAFVKQMNAQPFDDFWTPLIVWGLPSVEFIAAGLLLFKRTKFIGLCLSLILMIIFTVYIKLVISNHYGYIPCACGGIIRKFTWWQHLWFNLYFVLLGVIGVLLSFLNRKNETSNLHASPAYR